MSGLLLKKFSNKISEQVIDQFFKNLSTVSFNALTAVSNTTYFFTVPNTGDTAFFNNDIVRYYTGAGGTVVTNLANGSFYKITSANSTGFKLANVSTNATISVVASSSETHYISAENPSYYFVLSKHTPWADENNPDTPTDNLQEVRSFQREMIIGKRIDRSDIAYMIRKVDWATGTVYSHYDDTDDNLFETDFYVLTDESNVYKCLDNNNGTYSTTKPTGKLTTKFQTSDGYVWKYMYTLSSSNNAKFSTTEYIPVDSNTSISSAAVNGSIEFVQITTVGSGYTGFATGYVQQVISNTLFQVETSTTATSNDYYNTSGFYIDSGTGSGQLTVVEDYIVNSTGHYVQTSENLDAPALDLTSVYLLSPQVKFSGDGTGLKAYSNVSTTGSQYSISAINIINRGQNYSYCEGSIISNPAYGTGATIRPVISPENGHGYNQPAELGASYIGFSTSFSNSESGTITTNPKFRKTGIIYGPRQHSNTSLYYSNTLFEGLYTMAYSLTSTPTTFQEGEIVVGQTSDAHGIVAWANSSYMEFSYQYGEFFGGNNIAIGEGITGSTSGAAAIITSINTSDIHKYTNEVIYYDYVLPIQRSNTTTETAKLLIAI